MICSYKNILIAGKPLEPCSLIILVTNKSEVIWIGQSAAKPLFRGTFNDYPEIAVESCNRSRSKWIEMDILEDIV